MEPHQRLRTARIEAGYRFASDASKAFGWPEGAYRHHENGTRKFSIEQALKYGKALHVSPNWLVGWRDERDRMLIEEFRDNLIGTDRAMSTGEFSDILSERFRLEFINRLPVSAIQPNADTLDLNNADYYVVDRVLAEKIVEDRRVLVAVEIDMAIQGIEFPIGSLLFLDMRSVEDNGSDPTILFSHGRQVGVSRLWRHPDKMIELRDVAGTTPLRLAEDHVAIWGRVVWSLKPQ